MADKVDVKDAFYVSLIGLAMLMVAYWLSTPYWNGWLEFIAAVIFGLLGTMLLAGPIFQVVLQKIVDR